ncbi:hypothetical protein AB4850_02320 [Burkholderia sp. 22PA0106]
MTDTVGSVALRVVEDCEALCEAEAAGAAPVEVVAGAVVGAVWATATSGAKNTVQARAETSARGFVLSEVDMGERAVVSKNGVSRGQSRPLNIDLNENDS